MFLMLQDLLQSPPFSKDNLQLTEELQQILSKHYHRHSSETHCDSIWDDLRKCYGLSLSGCIQTLYTNEALLLHAIGQNTRQILSVLLQHYDPSRWFLKTLMTLLVPSLEQGKYSLNTLNVCLFVLNRLFEQQTPTNVHLESYILQEGGEGVQVEEKVRWPFEHGGTIALWYNMSEQTKECKLFELVNGEKAGFEIVLRNRRIYFQKLSEDKGFRLRKNNQAYICEAVFGANTKLCVEFEIKKRFFQPCFSINVISDNFAMNNIEVDAVSFALNDFTLSLFKHFHGKIYSILLLSRNLSAQVEELNSRKGFIYENDIRNFTCIFEHQAKNIYLLFSAIRARTINVNEEMEDEGLLAEEQPNRDPLSRAVRIPLGSWYKIPKYTILFDAVNRHNGRIGAEACLYQNISIKKEISNYGGLVSYLPFLSLLELNWHEDSPEYEWGLNEYLSLLKNLFLNKTESIEQASRLRLFPQLAEFLTRTRMTGFHESTLSNLKEMYISLNTRMMRETFIREIIWAIPAGEFLEEDRLDYYVRFVKLFYNEDVNSTLSIFNITDIVNFMYDSFDQPNCCLEHARATAEFKPKIKNYPHVLQKYFSIVENILFLKHADENLKDLVSEIVSVFKLNTSACFMEGLIDFAKKILQDKEEIFNNYLLDSMQASGVRMSVYTLLAYATSCRTKAKLTSFILQIYGDKIHGDKMNSDKQCCERELLSLCIRYPTMSTRISSIKSQDYESVENSQDRTSLNSYNMTKFVTIKPINSHDMVLLNDDTLISILWEWGLSATVQASNQENENPGVCVLQEVYKGSSYKLRKHISALFLQKKEVMKFTPDLMAWMAECLLVCEYDERLMEHSDELLLRLIGETKLNLLRLICEYRMEEAQSAEQNELHIIKLVLASVRNKYPQEVAQLSSVIFLLISEQTVKNYCQLLKSEDWREEKKLRQFASNIVSNVYRCLLQYFTSHEDDLEFEEDALEQAEREATIALRILAKFYELLQSLAAPNMQRLMSEENAQRNKWLLELLFAEKQDVSLLCLVLVELQMLFECFQDLNIGERKIVLALVKNFLLLLMQISENSGKFKLEGIEDELRSTFTNTLGFLENKFYQYFYYAFDRHKNLESTVENRIRKNVEDIKRTILNCFFDLIDLIKYVDETGSMQHLSFYQLMKPKKKLKSDIHLKNFYPTCWKKADQKINQFIQLSSEVLRQDGRDKLEAHLLQRGLSVYASSLEKAITIKIETFVLREKKKNQGKEKNSLFFYMQNESDKCRTLQDYEEQIAVLTYEHGNRQKQDQFRRNMVKEKVRRQVLNHKRAIWNHNRVFEGFWANKDFYSFGQNDEGVNSQPPNAGLQELYCRVRSPRQSRFCLTPLLSVQARQLEERPVSEEEQYLPESSPAEESGEPKISAEKSKSEKYLKIGIQFIKKRVIEKIMRSSLLSKEEKEPEMKEEFLFRKTLLVLPMKTYQGILGIDPNTLSFQHCPSQEVQHISLLRNKQTSFDLFKREWALQDIQCFQLKKFMLRPNAVEIFFKNRTSIFLCLPPRSSSPFHKFIELLSKFKKEESIERAISPIRPSDPFKSCDKYALTDAWRNREISNLDYLMALNVLSGRSNCDLNQYFVLPWTLANYATTRLKKDQSRFRDFDKNMGSLGSPERINKFIEIKNTIQKNYKEEFIQPHFFGFHYSNIAIVLQYLIRVSPFAEGAIHLQGGKFDIPDRLFISVAESFQNATTQMSDLRELIPEFFYLPEMLINLQGFEFGVQQSLRKVDHVELPDGFQNAYDFIEHHRQALESEHVSENIHKWIDLIFGYKQYGKEAELAFNKFHYLAYQNNIPAIFPQETFESPENATQKCSVESQLAYFGKVPSQIFFKPHPKRSPLPNLKGDNKYSRANPFVNMQLPSPSLETQMIRHRKGFFSLAPTTPIFMDYSKSNRRYLSLRRDGRGIAFSLERSQAPQRPFLLQILEQFNLGLDKYENIFIYDERVYFERLPICSMWGQHIFIGGLWGGRILKFSLNGKLQFVGKHSDTVSALCAQDSLGLVVSGTINGQIALWDYIRKGGDAFQVKMIFKDKVAPHCGRVNSITINVDLKVAVCSSQDGLMSLICLEKCELLRTLKLGFPVLDAVLVGFPYYLYFIVCEGDHQFSYSLNGQLLETSAYGGINLPLRVSLINGFRELVAIKKKGDNNITWLRLPEITEEFRVELKPEDQDILQAVVEIVGSRAEILFNTTTHMVWCSQSIEKEITADSPLTHG